MKPWLALAGIMVVAAAAVVVAERRKVETQASAAAFLYLIGDTEQELTRMPVRFTQMSDEDEVRIGNQIAKNYPGAMEAKDKADADTVEIRTYIGQVGARLASHAHRKLPYRFHYIPEKYFINAFAVPGGHVYIGAGLLGLMDSEDELAAVLGHEIEHIDHYHCAERVQTEQALRRIPLSAFFELPIELFQAGYSKNQELEADREGTRLAVETGYSANGAIRMFETFQRLYDEYRGRARTPQEELSQVTRDTLEGYFRTHPLPAERISQVNTMIASSGWTPRAERDLAVAYVFWTARAEDAFNAGKYRESQQFAARSLQLRPDLQKALALLAQAQFAQADFSGAAATYRRILETPGSALDEVSLYAMALAAANRASAANEFRRWMGSAKGDNRKLQAPLAGLLLLNGDPGPARELLAQIRANPGDPSVPGVLSDLGWWWYMAGNYGTAAQLLDDAVQQRPGSLNLLVRLAWAQIETRRLADAFRTMKSMNDISASFPEQMATQAVAQWQAQERDTALHDFEILMNSQTQWENQRWVKALYSPLVAQSIQEMQSELERRRKIAEAARP
jgi:predicted Zn-dependent protease